MLGHDPVRKRLWKGSVDIITFTDGDSLESQGRQVEIFVDMLTAHAVESPTYFLRREYSAMLMPAEKQLAEDFERPMVVALAEDVRPSVREAFGQLRRVLGAPDSMTSGPGRWDVVAESRPGRPSAG